MSKKNIANLDRVISKLVPPKWITIYANSLLKKLGLNDVSDDIRHEFILEVQKRVIVSILKSINKEEYKNIENIFNDNRDIDSIIMLVKKYIPCIELEIESALNDFFDDVLSSHSVKK